MDSPVCHRLALDAEDEILPWLVGIVVASGLFGAQVILVANYFADHHRDRIFEKIIVGLLLCLSTIAWSIDLYLLYYLAILARDDDMMLVTYPQIFSSASVFVPISSALSQVFFGYRSYLVSERNKLVAGFLAVLILTSFTLGVVTLALNNTRFVLLDYRALEFISPPPMRGYDVLPLELAFLGMVAGTDVIITAFLVFKLSMQFREQRTADEGLDSVIIPVIRISISSAAISSGFTIALLALTIQTGKPSKAGGAVWALAVNDPHVLGLNVLGTITLRSRLQKKNRRRMSLARDKYPSSRTGVESTESVPAILQELGIGLTKRRPDSSTPTNHLKSYEPSRPPDVQLHHQSSLTWQLEGKNKGVTDLEAGDDSHPSDWGSTALDHT